MARLAVAYVRETDNAKMIEVAPFVFVNSKSARILGLLGRKKRAPKKKPVVEQGE